MICIPAGYKPAEPYTGSTWTLRLRNSDHVMVQAYSTDESEGMVEADAIQNGKILTIDFGRPVTGYPVLVLPSKTAEFVNESHWSFRHNLGHWVCAQVFIDEQGQAFPDIHNISENVVEVYFNKPVSGYLLVA